MGRRKLKAKSKAGGAQKKKQKMDIDAQPGSSSSSLSNAQAEMNNQLELEELSLIDQLPPEMLMKILEFLDVKNLALSRLVSRKWNGMAREILKSREDVETVFNCETTENGERKIDGKTERASLDNFIKHFEDSKEHPLYTRFRFNDIDIDSPIFYHQSWPKFISDFGQKIKSLKLMVNGNGNWENVPDFAYMLRHVLLDQLPNLQEFGLQLPSAYSDWIPGSSTFHPLFSERTSNYNEETTTSAAVQLPLIKILHLDASSFSQYTQITKELVHASVNLQKIEPFEKYDSNKVCEEDTVFVLHSLGKLDCLQEASIQLYFLIVSLLKIKFLHPNMPAPSFKLKKLCLIVSPIHKKEDFWPKASEDLSNLFESTKDTLRECKMQPLGFLPDLQLSKFNKLTNLHIFKLDDEQVQVLPSGLNLMEIFPALQSLKLQVPWTDFFPHDEKVSFIPNLKTLEITGCELKKEDIARISQVCPNLKELKIGSDLFVETLKDFPEVGEAIWTHLKQLESLDLKIDASSPANVFPAIDSTITGFSGEDCIHLNNLIEIHGKVSESELELDVERTNASILNLKGLKNLTICLLSQNRMDEENLDSLIKKILTVSENYALKLMQNLKFSIEERFTNL